MMVPCKCREGKYCPICEILDTYDQEIVSRIAKDINDRMSKYTHSMHPTNDEVSIAWLLTYITKLQGKIAVYQEVIDNECNR